MIGFCHLVGGGCKNESPHGKERHGQDNRHLQSGGQRTVTSACWQPLDNHLVEGNLNVNRNGAKPAASRVKASLAQAFLQTNFANDKPVKQFGPENLQGAQFRSFLCKALSAEESGLDDTRRTSP